MRRREEPDPVARERYERVWPAVAQPADFESEGDEGDRPGVISRPASLIPSPTSAALAAFSPSRRAIKALAVVAVVVVGIAAFLAWRSQPRAEAVSSTTASSSPTSSSPTSNSPTSATVEGLPPSVGAPVSSSSSAMIVVSVGGRVKHPGLVYLPPGSRVADAIAAAGGVLPNTDLSFTNLARKVSDGELILIGVQPPPGVVVDPTGGGTAAPGGSTAGPVDLNTASLAQLETLPGIGPALAQRILDYRTSHGSFHSVNDLQNVSGIGPAKFAAIKDLVTT